MNKVGVEVLTCDLSAVGGDDCEYRNWQRQYVHEKAALFSSLIKS